MNRSSARPPGLTSAFSLVVATAGALWAAATPAPATDAAPTPLAVPATRPADAGPATRPRPAAFPTFGAAFDLPSGWTEIPREKSGRLGQWISADSRPDAIQGLIMIESGRAGGNQPEVFARNLARNFGGIVMDDPTTLGGEPALRVRADNHDDVVAPTEAVVCVRGGNVYLVMGGTKKGRTVQNEVDAIAASWKWTDVQKASEHLGFREQSFRAFDGSVQMNAPALMHENAADDPDTQLDLALFSLARNAADFRVTLTLAPLPPGASPQDARDALIKDLAGKYKFVGPAPSWQDRKGSTPRFVSTVAEATRPQPAETDTLHHQWAVVSLGDGTESIVLIHFAYEAETDEERRKFEVAAERIVDSVEPAKKSGKNQVKKTGAQGD